MVGFAGWFRYGWTDLPLRCTDHGPGGPSGRHIYGNLRPQIADSFEEMLRATYGDAAVKRESPQRILVRPVVVYFDDDERLADLTMLVAGKFSDFHVDNIHRVDDKAVCRVIPHYLMVGGRADVCQDPWGTQFRFISQNVFPWVAWLFRVDPPSSNKMKQLLADDFQRFAEGPHRFDKLTRLPYLDCGSSKGDIVFFLFIYTVYHASQLWPF